MPWEWKKLMFLSKFVLLMFELWSSQNYAGFYCFWCNFVRVGYIVLISNIAILAKYRISRYPKIYRCIVYDTFCWLMGRGMAMGHGHQVTLPKDCSVAVATLCATATWLCPSGHPWRQKMCLPWFTCSWESWNKGGKYRRKYRDIWPWCIAMSTNWGYRTALQLWLKIILKSIKCSYMGWNSPPKVHFGAVPEKSVLVCRLFLYPVFL